MRVLETGAGVVRQLAYSPCGTRLIAGVVTTDSYGLEGELHQLLAPSDVSIRKLITLQIQTGELLSSTRLAMFPRRLAFTNDGAAFYATKNWIRRLVATSESQRRTNYHSPTLSAFGVAPDSRRLALAWYLERAPDRSTRIAVEDAAGDEPPQLMSSSVRVVALAFSPDYKLLASAGEGGVTIWELARAESIAVWQTQRVETVGFTPSGSSVVVSAGQRMYMCSATTGKPVFEIEPSSKVAISDFAFSPDGRVLATVAGEVVDFWDAAGGQHLRSFHWNIGELRAIAFAPDGLTAAVGGDRGQIVIWDVDQ